MREYLKSFFDEYEYTARERVALAAAYERIAENAEARKIFTSILDAYDKDNAAMTDGVEADIRALAELAGVNPLTAILLTVICLSRRLRVRLAELGFSKKIIGLTLADFKYKMIECEYVYGVPGTEHWTWYVRFFALKLVGIGRLQFELTEFKGGTYKKGDKVLKSGDRILAVHIPRNGAPLTDRACLSAYKEAREVFCKLLSVEDIPFRCASWLLYPKNKEFLPPSSNIVKFMSRYDILEVTDLPREGSSAISFLFGVRPDTPHDALPRRTSLQAAYADHLLAGGCMGSALGVFFLDNILK